MTTETIAKETHEALLEKALRDAATDLSAKLETATSENAELSNQNVTLTEELDAVKADNARINGELDAAQIALKAATDEVAALKSAADEAARAAEQAQLSTTRAEVAKNLGLFGEDYIAERASVWGALPETDWAARVEEWKAAKPAAPGTTTGTTDAASAMSGTGGLTDEAQADTAKKTPARRTVLGLS